MSSHGKFCWYELMADDPDAAATFYGAVFGWGTQAFAPGVDYRLFTRDGANQGGLMKTREGGPPPGWVGYVAVDDCEGFARDAIAAGATGHMGPHKQDGVGTLFIFSDPQGALLAVIQPPDELKGQGGAPQAAWHELHTSDAEAAWAFYAPLFGWAELSQMDMGPAGMYRVFGPPGDARGTGGMMNDGQAERPYWQFYHGVERVEPAMERVTEAGGTIRHGPAEVPGEEWVAMCADPEGAAFCLHSKDR